jgi:hypothetical protein
MNHMGMEWVQEMVKRLQVTVNGEKDRVIAEYQQLTGKSAATLYRIARGAGYCSGRKKRCDAGACELNEEQIRFVSTLIQTTAREVKGPILPVTEALSIAIDNGVIREGQISESRMQGILREREMHAAAIKSVDPSIRMASLHPNHVHVFDASICIQYYLKNRKGLGFVDERDFREKKPKNYDKIKQRIFRMVLADHFSHYLFVKYYITSGEKAAITYDFLTSAWRGGHHEKAPFRGVPMFLLMDAGSANIAKGIMALLGRLDIDTPPNMVHNPKRQGSAETAQQLIETHFEARLKMQPATTVEDLNRWVTDWLVKWNGQKIHKRHKMTRTGCWLKHIRQEHLRDLPSDDILHDLYAEPEVTRTVAQDNTISFRTHIYWLKHIEGISPGKQVQVILKPYHWPQAAVVFNDVEYMVAPVGIREGGFLANAAVIGQQYKRQPDTRVQKVRAANENLAYGEQRKKNDLPFGGTLQVMGHQADKVAAVPMPRKGTPIEIDKATVAAQKVPVMAFFTALRATGAPISPELNQAIRSTYGTALDVREKQRLLDIARENGALTINDLGEDHAASEAIAV